MAYLCEDCRFFRSPDRCAKQPHPVTGEPRNAGDGLPQTWRGNAQIQRMDGWFDRTVNNSCGAAGRFWQPKTTAKSLADEANDFRTGGKP